MEKTYSLVNSTYISTCYLGSDPTKIYLIPDEDISTELRKNFEMVHNFVNTTGYSEYEIHGEFEQGKAFIRGLK